MRYSHKLSDAVHILAYVVIYADGDLSSDAIAASIESNPSLVRRLMSRLRQAQLLRSRAGVSTPKLAQPADQITLLTIYRAIEDNQQLLHVDPKTNPQCIVGGQIQATLNQAYRNVQQAAEAEMANITLQNLIDDILQRQAKKF